MGQYHGLSIGTINLGSLSSWERRHWEAFQGGVVHAPYPFPYRRPRGMSEEDYGEWALSYIEDQILKHVAPAAELRPGPPTPVRRPRLVLHRRRGRGGPRPDGEDVGDRALRRGAGPRRDREGPERGAPPHRRRPRDGAGDGGGGGR